MPNKTGRPPTEINWPLAEQLVRFHGTIGYICRQLHVDEKRFCREIKRIYNESWPVFAKRLREEEGAFLIGKAMQKAHQGNDKWMFHILKHYYGHNDFELERQVRERHERKDDDKKKSAMTQILESSRELVEKIGSVAEPKPLKK